MTYQRPDRAVGRRVPKEYRCDLCKGWGDVEPPPSYNHGLPLESSDFQRCIKCMGTGRRAR